MKVVIELAAASEAEALPVLLRHAAGTALRGGIYIVEQSAARALRERGIQWKLIGSDAGLPTLSENPDERVRHLHPA